jgi:tetratricopeptide (TPR) repeat protein
MADPIGGISTSITLDVTDALNQFDQFKNEITKTSTVARDNPALEEFFGGAASGAKDAAAEVAKLRKQLEAMNRSLGSATAGGGMNMAALAKAAKQVGSMDMKALAAYSGTSYRQIPDLQKAMARSTRYTQIGERGDAARQQRYELGFQNRYLEREIGTGDMRKRIVETVKAEREAKKLAATHDRLIRQTKLMEAQVKYGRYGGAAAYFYGQNRETIAGAGRMAGGVAMGAAGTVAGLAASGYSGTVEGERFSLETRRLSLELAASFKPFMDALTDATRYVRKFIQEGGEERQNQIMQYGGAAAGAMVGYKIGGVPGAVVGGIAGYGIAESVTHSQKKEAATIEYGKAMQGMSQEERDAFIKKEKAIISGMMRADGTPTTMWERITRDTDEEKRGNLLERGARQEALAQFQRENRALVKSGENNLGKIASDALSGKKTPGMVQEDAKKESRKLMLTEGVGFAEAGSTYYDLAETLIRTQAAEANKPIIDKLDELKQEFGKLNK